MRYVVYSQVGEELGQPMDPSNSSEVQAGLSGAPLSGCATSISKVMSGRNYSNAERAGHLIEKSAILHLSPQHDQCGFYSTIVLTPKKKGNVWPVRNLRPLNCFIQSQHFRIEGTHLLNDILQRENWLIHINLKDAYFTIPIYPPHQEFLQFSQKSQCFQFTCLPFGLSSAPQVFTKLLKLMVGLKSQGVCCIIYINDLLMTQSQTIARQHTTTA